MLAMGLIVCGMISATVYVQIDALIAGGRRHVTPDELHDAGSRWMSQAFHVRYRITFPMGVAEMVWYHGTADELRIDYSYEEDGSKHSRTYVQANGSSFTCREPGRCAPGDDLFDEPHTDALAALYLTFFIPLSQIGAPPDRGATSGQNVKDLTRYPARIAGTKATCFQFLNSTSLFEVCFSEDGIPVLLAQGDPDVRSSFEAVEIVRGTTHTDFKPAHPLER